MIGPIEKGIRAAQMGLPPRGTYQGIDLSRLPRFLSFKAALLKAQVTHQYWILILLSLIVVQFTINRLELGSLYHQLRTKEYILAPGVQDFTPASVQSVPDSYVSDAATEYLNQLGNITAGNIDEQYRLLAANMSPQLQIRFLSEATEFKQKVKSENLSELFTIHDKQIRASEDGYYQVIAWGKRDTYANNEYLGNTEEGIEMTLQLVPPRSGKRWFLQINSLARMKADLLQVKKNF